MPPVFNVDFLEPRANPLNVHGSKAVGEPPLLLAVCVWTAVKHALSFASGGRVPTLDLPATNEEVLRRLAEYERLALRPKQAVASDSGVRARSVSDG